MKKLISIGVALALLVTFMVPVAVAADFQENPGTYAKTPFGILGTGILLLVDVLTPVLDEFAPDFLWLTDIMPPVGNWTGTELAWMTDMTAWSMVLFGDVMKMADPVLSSVAELPVDLGDVADIFYVVGARLWDPWGTYVGDATLPTVVIDAYEPTLPLLP